MIVYKSKSRGQRKKSTPLYAHVRKMETFCSCGASAVKYPLSKSVESCRDFLKHCMALCSIENLFRKTDASLHNCHLLLIIDLDIRETSDIGGIGALVHISLKNKPNFSNLSGLTTRRG